MTAAAGRATAALARDEGVPPLPVSINPSGARFRTASLLSELRGIGADQVQGFLLSAPLERDAFEALLREQAAPARPLSP